MNIIKIKANDNLYCVKIENISHFYFDKMENKTRIFIGTTMLSVEGDMSSKLIKIITSATNGTSISLE